VRVLVDARSAVAPERTGVGQYTWQLLRWLPRVDPETAYVAWSLDARGLMAGTSAGRGLAAAPNLTERRTPIPSRLFDPLARRLSIPRMEWLERYDLLFAPNFVPPPTRRPVAITVHDVAFRVAPETVPRRTARWLGRIERAIRQAVAIVVPSEAVRRDLVEAFPVPADRISVVPHGVDPDVFHAAEENAVTQVRRQFGIEGPFLLFLGGLEPRKNLPRLLEAFARLPGPRRPALVVAGSGVRWNPEGPDQLRAGLRRLPIDVRHGVVLTGYVSEPQKVALLTGAAALVYPSLYEGFGLPVLEAMACGTPVLTSNVSALPEVAGDAALLVDPRDTDAVAAGMQRLLEDEALGRRLADAGLIRAARFRWQETAARTAAVLHDAADMAPSGRPSTAREGRRR
jgi:glycosyltransferase involved in cell wall biosynthesis